MTRNLRTLWSALVLVLMSSGARAHDAPLIFFGDHTLTDEQVRLTHYLGSGGAVAVVLLMTVLVVLAMQRHQLRRENEWRWQVQAELVEAKAIAEAANRAKTTFLAAASHDLRQPFQALRLFLGMLSDHLPESGLGRAAHTHAVKAYESAECLLTSLMEISRLEAGAVTAEMGRVALGPLMRELAEECRPSAEANGLVLRLRDLAVDVHTDPILLRRLLRNLIVNAVLYTPSGGILLAGRRRGDRVVAEVWDTGSGIPTDKLDVIFEDFHQLDDTQRRDVNGLGLGLAIVAKTARLLGHVVAVRSRLGRGSVFTVDLGPALDG